MPYTRQEKVACPLRSSSESALILTKAVKQCIAIGNGRSMESGQERTVRGRDEAPTNTTVTIIV